MRFIGLLFMAEGAVKSTLPPEFAIPAAYGDVFAALAAMVALAAVRLGFPSRCCW